MNKFINIIKNNKKKVIILSVIIIVLLGFFAIKSKSSNKGPVIAKSETTTLAKKDLTSSVNESGTVKAEKSMQVFATKSLPVKEIFVKVGDKVNEGDIIAKLDDSSIKQQIAQKNAAISSTNKSAGTQIKSAKDKLNEAHRNKNEGTNAALISANNAVVSAYDAWQAQEKIYNDFKKSIEEGYNEQIVASESSKDSLNSAIKSAELNKRQSEEKKNETYDKISENESKADDAKDDVRKYERRVEKAQREVARIETEITKIENSIKSSDEKENNNNKKTNNNNNSKNEENTISLINYDDLNNFKKDLIDAQRDLSKAQKDLASAEADKSKYENIAEESRNAIDSIDKEIEQTTLAAENARESLATNYKQDLSSKKSREDMLKTYRSSADSAHNSYIAALENLKSTEVSVDDEIRALENNLKSANAGADNSMNAVDLKYLKEDLADTIIKSPVSGAITELDAEIGTAPTSAVAKVETLNKVIVESHIKEFDVNNIKLGMKVEITSDALSKKDVFEGKVISIDPTPEKKAQGATSNEVYYKTQIELVSKDLSKLKPGMNVRVKYILEENKDVFTVPSTAIYEKGNKKFVLGIKKSASGSTIQEYEVKTGSENDIETIITGDNVRNKLIIINAPENYSNGMEISVEDSPEIK